MDLIFANGSLKKLCEDPREAKKKLGEASTKRLQSRIADLMAAAQLGDIPAGQPHPLKGARAGQFAIRLSGGCRLVIEANDDPIPTTADESTDWRRVTSIRIVFIGDYHD